MAPFHELKDRVRHATKVLERVPRHRDRVGQYKYREVSPQISPASVKTTPNLVRSIRVATLHTTYKHTFKRCDALPWNSQNKTSARYSQVIQLDQRLWRMKSLTFGPVSKATFVLYLNQATYPLTQIEPLTRVLAIRNNGKRQV